MHWACLGIHVSMGRVGPSSWLVAILVGSLLSACSNSTPPSGSTGGYATAGSRSGSASDVGHGTSGHDAAGMDAAGRAGASVSASEADSAAPTSPTEAALHFEALMGQHSVLASDMMRARVRADSDLAQAATAALSRNTEAMGNLLQPVIGAPGRTQFATLWGGHVEALFHYARGLATGDTAGRMDARAKLVDLEDQLAGFFAAGSHGRLSRADARPAVRMHIDHLLQGADAYAAKDYESSARLYRQSYSHTFDLGATLARALLAPSVAKALGTPSLRLRSALTKLLGEHVSLVTAAMRASIGDRADFSSIGAALNGNTLDLTAAIDSLFGRASAERFQAQWADHVDQLLAYTSAVVQGDAAGQERARRKLRTFERVFASFLNTATEDRLGQAALAQTFLLHDRMLLAAIDAFAAKNYQQAHDLSYRAYEDMFAVAGQLARVIGATIAGRLPQGGAETGGGYMAELVEAR